jgi:hypothetical protein
MNRLFIALLALAAVAIVPAPIAAQDVNVTVGANSTDSCSEPVVIDNHTAVCSATLDGRIAELVVWSDRPQRGIVLTDASRRTEHGEIPRSRYQLREGTNTLRLRLAETSGRRGVTIDTGEVLYGIPLGESSSIISGPFDGRDAQITALGGATSVAMLTRFLVVRAVTGRSDEPERIA